MSRCDSCRWSETNQAGGLDCRAFSLQNVSRAACDGYQYEPGLQSARLHPVGFLRLEHKRQMDALPRRFVPAVEREWMQLYKKSRDLVAGNEMLRQVYESIAGYRFNVAANDTELVAFAEARAGECLRVLMRWQDADVALGFMIEIASRYGIDAPAGRDVTKTGMRARLICPLWWRRQVRRVAGRNVESAAIRVGLVHRKAGLYASDEAVAQRAGQKRRNRALLDSIIAQNDEGQEYTLSALSDLGVSNPEIRRGELMTRLAGFDDLAKKLKHAAEFYTITAPSKFHARDSITGRKNPTYQGATPTETQRYLTGLWAKARAALHRRGIGIYGFRVAEPHHDGCPHWHMVLFMEPQHVAQVRAILKKYALQVDGNEKGADKHRFKAEMIDRSKGSAAGYLAKYISKNIDGKNAGGESIGEDYEAVEGKSDATKSARRVDTWAARWGIRQFQQIGGAPVSVWRELRRMKGDDAPIDEGMQALIAAADAGGDRDDALSLNGWGRYVELMGGPFAKRAAYAVRMLRQGVQLVEGGIMGALNKYGEVAALKLRGLVHTIRDKFGEFVAGLEYVTRSRVWAFKRSGAAASPWSSVNNCTRPESEAPADGQELTAKNEFSALGAEFCPVDSRNPGGVPVWDALPAYMQRVRAALFFDGRGMVWQG